MEGRGPPVDNSSPPPSSRTDREPASTANPPQPPLHSFSFEQDKQFAAGHLVNDYLPTPSPASSYWFAADPSKAYYEKFSLVWAPLAMFILLAVVLGTPLYKHCDRNMLLLITIVFCLPGLLIPLFFPCEADRARPFHRRFWVKASLWIIIFDFYGNYFWTHYFYRLLGAQYLFDAHRFNDVPVVTFTATFFYFSFYFNFATVLLRRVDRAVADFPPFGRRLIWIVAVCALSYATAVFEAVSIQHFPLYTYTERTAFLTVGSVFYGLYFVIGFPAFYALDEPDAASVYARERAAATSAPAAGASANDDEGSDAELDVLPCSAYDAAMGALASVAIVTLLLDLWRLCLGSIYELGLPSAGSIQIPFIYQPEKAAVSDVAASVAGTCAPTPTPQIIIVDRPVTPEACASVARKWALDRVPLLRRMT